MCPVMRKVGAALLFMLAGAFLLLAFAALEGLWAEYQDSPDSTYIELATIWAVIALGFAGLGGWLLRGR
jgi:hypothetical protein